MSDGRARLRGLEDEDEDAGDSQAYDSVDIVASEKYVEGQKCSMGQEEK